MYIQVVIKLPKTSRADGQESKIEILLIKRSVATMSLQIQKPTTKKPKKFLYQQQLPMMEFHLFKLFLSVFNQANCYGYTTSQQVSGYKVGYCCCYWQYYRVGGIQKSRSDGGRASLFR